MESHGHNYDKGHCPYCGSPTTAIDGQGQCDCHLAEAVRLGEMTKEEAKEEAKKLKEEGE